MLPEFFEILSARANSKLGLVKTIAWEGLWRCAPDGFPKYIFLWLGHLFGKILHGYLGKGAETRILFPRGLALENLFQFKNS